MAKLLTVSNQKGGCGKSSITMFLAAALAGKGKKVAILDLDTQRTIFDFYTNSDKPIVSVFSLNIEDLEQWLIDNERKYSVIFLDLPRFTSLDGGTVSAKALFVCDGVLVPILGTHIDAMAAISFIKFLKEYEKVTGGTLSGVINKDNRRRENNLVKGFINKSGLPMFDSSLKDLTLFTIPDLESSILESKEGRKRFEPFFNEFCKTYKIKTK